jgi:hypothetical protein
MAEPVWFDYSYYQAKAHALLPFCKNTGDFAFQGFTQIQFPEWQEFAESPSYPQPKDEDDDYLINRAARLFCRATDRLVEERAFEQLRLVASGSHWIRISRSRPICIVPAQLAGWSPHWNMKTSPR